MTDLEIMSNKMAIPVAVAVVALAVKVAPTVAATVIVLEFFAVIIVVVSN